MHATVGDVRTLDELRRYIHESLCAKENLVPNEFAISEVRLIRGGQMCGMQFCLRGPRSVSPGGDLGRRPKRRLSVRREGPALREGRASAAVDEHRASASGVKRLLRTEKPTDGDRWA